MTLDTLDVRNRDEWRAWLEAHHATVPEIWLIFYRKGSGQPRIPYDDAVEEALCFGWIDSLIRRLDDDRYAQKFTPRRPTSRWSESNRLRVHALIRSGRMSEAGLAVIPEAILNSDPTPIPKPVLGPPVIPPDLRAALDANPSALDHFHAFTEKYIHLALRWIEAARRAETRQRRIAEFVELTARNEKIGMK